MDPPKPRISSLERSGLATSKSAGLSVIVRMHRRIAPRAGTARKEEIIVRKVMGDVGLGGLMIVMGCASASSVKVTGRKFLGAGVNGSGFH